MQEKSGIRTSKNDPLRIAELPLGRGVMGLTICPGKKDKGAMHAPCWRDLELDLQAVKDWGAGIVVTLMEEHELQFLHVVNRGDNLPDFGDVVATLGMQWLHLPVVDQCPLNDSGDSADYWNTHCDMLRNFLHTGGRVLIHCRGGLGRTGTLAARLLIEDGMDADTAMQTVRAVRPGAIETQAQEDYLRNFSADRIADVWPWPTHFDFRPRPKINLEDARALRKKGPPPGWSALRAYFEPEKPSDDSDPVLQRAQGCLLGQLIGDSLGSLVEFQTPEEIKKLYPQGVRDLADGGTWDTLAGQPTDDSELALMLANSLVAQGKYDRITVLEAYKFWARSEPFDCGRTTGLALLHGIQSPDSQANGALMRISPLGIFGANHPRALADPDYVFTLAEKDAILTHPHVVCRKTNGLFAEALANAIRTKTAPEDGYAAIAVRARAKNVPASLHDAIRDAADNPPRDYCTQQGWVLIAFQNALWQLLHARNPEEGIVDTVMRGGDTDTNAAICGALFGAVYGIDAIPQRWVETVLRCTPNASDPKVRTPRPECFWPVGALGVARNLLYGEKN